MTAQTKMREQKVSKTENEVEKVINLPKNVNISSLMNSKGVKNIIDEQMTKSKEEGEKVRDFIENSLIQIFNKGKTNSKEIEKIFEAIVTQDEVKEELNMIFDAFSDSSSSEVNNALRNLDDELRQVSKPLKVMQNTLEGTNNFFSGILKSISGKSDAVVLSNTMKGIRGRVENISLTLAKGKEEVKRNQELLQKITPKIGIRIAKLKGMSEVLGEVITNNTEMDEGTIDLLTGLKQELDNLAAAQLSDLQKLSILVKINVNNNLLLTTTEKKIITKITSSILVNSIAGSESSIKSMVKSVDGTLQSLDRENTKQVKGLMEEEEKEKMRTKIEMEETIKSIEDLTKEIGAHNKRMTVINAKIKEFLPEYKKRLEKAEEGIYKNFQSSNNKEANDLLKELVKEANDITTKFKDTK